MSSHVVVQNNTPFDFNLTLRINAPTHQKHLLSFPSHVSLLTNASAATLNSMANAAPAPPSPNDPVADQMAASPSLSDLVVIPPDAGRQGDPLAQPSEIFVPANQAIEVYSINRKIPLREPVEIDASLRPIILVPEENEPTYEEKQIKPEEAHCELILKQKLTPKLLKTRPEISLAAIPFESLHPPQQWSIGVRTYDAIWNMRGEQIDVRYKCVLDPPSFSDVVYELNLLKEDRLTLSSAIHQGLPDNMFLEEVYENQRSRALSSEYSSNNLFSSERGQWSNVHGQRLPPKDYIDVPNAGWAWVNEWRVDKQGDVDSEGWEYAMGWKRTFSGRKSTKHMVRRRKWIRLRKRVEERIIISASQITGQKIDSYDSLLERLTEAGQSDNSRLNIIATYFLGEKQQLSAKQAEDILNTFDHQITRAEGFRRLKEYTENSDELNPLINTFDFFSMRRLLATEFGFELFQQPV